MSEKKWKKLEKDVNISIFPLYIYIEISVNEIDKVIGKNMDGISLVLENHDGTVYLKKGSFSDVGKIFLKKLDEDKKFIDKFEKKYKKCGANLLQFSSSFLNMGFNKKSNKELAEYLEKYREIWKDIVVLSRYTASLELEDQLLSTKLREYLSLKSSDVINDFNDLITSKELTIMERKELDLVNLTLEVKTDNNLLDIFKKSALEIEDEIKKKKDFNNLLEGLFSKYNFLSYSYEGPVWSKSFFIKMVKEKLKEEDKALKEKQSQFENRNKDIVQKQKTLIKKLKIDKEHEYYFDVMKRLIFLREYSKFEVSFQSRYHLEKLLHEIANRLELTLRELRCLTIPEIKSALIDNNLDKKEIKRRLGFAIIVGEENVMKIMSGDKARKYFDLNFEKVEAKNKNSLKGMVIHPGNVKGKVCIVNKVEDMNKMEVGDILVSYVTNPNLLPAIIKAKAVITDMGGITSHAAIVCREMKKTCIVGTKIATNIFKDGDEIEVDTDKSIVKRIK